MKLLKQKPVTHDMLDIVRHHREHGAGKEKAKIPVMKRGKGELFLGLFLYDLHQRSSCLAWNYTPGHVGVKTGIGAQVGRRSLCYRGRGRMLGKRYCSNQASH